MDKQERYTSKEDTWRSRLQRHAQSGKTIAAFCRDESVSTATFHIWRAKLAAASQVAAPPAQPTTFIDLGAVKDIAGVPPLARPPSPVMPSAVIGVRIDLGDGIVLTITRR